MSYSLISKMKKILIILLCLLLVGCQKGNQEEIAYGRYNELLTQLVTNTSFNASSEYFDASLEVAELDDGTYRYYVFIDGARIAMYDVIALAYLENSDLENEMQPSIGIFDTIDYTFIPNQEKREDGYVKGLVLSGLSDTKSFEVKLLIEWYDKELTNRSMEYLLLSSNEVNIDE